MLLQYTNIYAGNVHSNTNTIQKYNLFGHGSLRVTLCRFAKVNHDLTTQLSMITDDLLTTIFRCIAMYRNISKMVFYPTKLIQINIMVGSKLPIPYFKSEINHVLKIVVGDSAVCDCKPIC